MDAEERMAKTSSKNVSCCEQFGTERVKYFDRKKHNLNLTQDLSFTLQLNLQHSQLLKFSLTGKSILSLCET